MAGQTRAARGRHAKAQVNQVKHFTEGPKAFLGWLTACVGGLSSVTQQTERPDSRITRQSDRIGRAGGEVGASIGRTVSRRMAGLCLEPARTLRARSLAAAVGRSRARSRAQSISAACTAAALVQIFTHVAPFRRPPPDQRNPPRRSYNLRQLSARRRLLPPNTSTAT